MKSTSPFAELIVDLDIVRSNIRNMAEKAKQNNAEFRPHCKTHQSKAIGKILREFDVNGITVSSIKMAEYFADDGWNDITIAFPANVLATDRYNALADKIDVKTLIISEKVVRKLDEKLNASLGLYVEIDPEYGRSGISASDTSAISDVLNAIENSENCYLTGFYCHAGHAYAARSKEEVNSIARKALQKLQELKKQFPDIPLCYGDTPSCSVLDDLSPADQISPGNFVFYDWMQVEIGSCSPKEIAVHMECPVIEKFEKRKQLLIHGGAVHFSKEEIQVNGHQSFGQVITDDLSPENYVSKISQEHGIIDCTAETYETLNVGDKVKIFPIHSCLNADLMGEYFTKDGERLEHLSGKSIR